MKKLLLTISALCVALSLSAQQNKKLSTEVVTVEKGYNAKVSKSEKASLSPDDAPKQTEKLSVEYSSAAQSPKFSYNVEPIEPLMLQNASSKSIYPNYIKAGVGIKSSTMIDGFYNFTKKRHSFTASVSEDGAHRDFDDEENIEDKNAVFYHSAIQLDYKYDMSRSYNFMASVKNKANSFSNENSYSNYDSSFKNNTISADLAVNAKSSDKVFSGAKLGFYHYSGIEKSKETGVNLATGFNVGIAKNFNFVLDIAAEYYNTKHYTVQMDGGSSYRPHNAEELFNAKAIPAVTFKTDRLDLYAGVHLANVYDSKESENRSHIMPEIKAAYSLVDGLTSIYGRLTSGYTVNGLSELSNANPFMDPTQEAIYTLEKFNAEIGVSGVFSSKLRYDLQIGYKAVDHMPMWLLSYGDYIAFGEDVNVFKIGASLDYTINKSHRANAFVQFNNPNTDSSYEIPYFSKVKIGASYRGSILDDKISLFARAVFNSSSKALVINPSVAERIENKNFDAWIEYQANATFNISERWGVFVEANNTINSSAHNFYGVRAVGFRALAGVKFNF